MVLKFGRFEKQIRNLSKYLFWKVVLEKAGISWSERERNEVLDSPGGQKHRVYCKMMEG